MKRILLGLSTGSLALFLSSTAQAADCVKVGIKVLPGTPDCIPNDAASGGAIVFYLKQILQLLGGGIFAVIVLMIVIAGIQYITANGQPANVAKAKDRIRNALTALILFAAAGAILNFIIPGGVLK